MADLILPIKKDHSADGWIVIGDVSVDSGTVHVGDIDCGPLPREIPSDKNWATDGGGTVVRTLYGDDVYQVWAQVDEDGDVERILVEFGAWSS